MTVRIAVGLIFGATIGLLVCFIITTLVAAA